MGDKEVQGGRGMLTVFLLTVLKSIHKNSIKTHVPAITFMQRVLKPIHVTHKTYINHLKPTRAAA